MFAHIIHSVSLWFGDEQGEDFGHVGHFRERKAFVDYEWTQEQESQFLEVIDSMCQANDFVTPSTSSGTRGKSNVEKTFDPHYTT